jgi:hypothetical protein
MIVELRDKPGEAMTASAPKPAPFKRLVVFTSLASSNRSA